MICRFRCGSAGGGIMNPCEHCCATCCQNFMHSFSVLAAFAVKHVEKFVVLLQYPHVWSHNKFKHGKPLILS